MFPFASFSSRQSHRHRQVARHQLCFLWIRLVPKHQLRTYSLSQENELSNDYLDEPCTTSHSAEHPSGKDVNATLEAALAELSDQTHDGDDDNLEKESGESHVAGLWDQNIEEEADDYCAAYAVEASGRSRWSAYDVSRWLDRFPIPALSAYITSRCITSMVRLPRAIQIRAVK